MDNNKPEGIGIGYFDENEIFNYQCYVYKLYLHVFKKKNEPESQEWSRVIYRRKRSPSCRRAKMKLTSQQQR